MGESTVIGIDETQSMKIRFFLLMLAIVVLSDITMAFGGVGLTASSIRLFGTIECDVGQNEEAKEPKNIEEKLIETLWRQEIEAKTPNYRMTREIFEICTNKEYTVEEKADLIYRARKLRQEFIIYQRNKKQVGEDRYNRIPRATQRSNTRGEKFLSRYLEFSKSEQGIMIVENLKNTKVGMMGLVEYLVKQYEIKQVTDRELNETMPKLSELSWEEQMKWLCRMQESKALHRGKASNKKRIQKVNEQGKPPIKPWRANGK